MWIIVGMPAMIGRSASFSGVLAQGPIVFYMFRKRERSCGAPAPKW